MVINIMVIILDREYWEEKRSPNHILKNSDMACKKISYEKETERMNRNVRGEWKKGVCCGSQGQRIFKNGLDHNVKCS